MNWIKTLRHGFTAVLVAVAGGPWLGALAGPGHPG